MQAASGGRFMLGIGLSHQIVIEDMFGLSFEKPVRHMREYLSILDAAAPRRARPRSTGETISDDTRSIDVDRRRRRRPVLVAALGPQMLKLAGTLTDGTVTWMTGPGDARRRTPCRRSPRPRQHAGRPAPRIARRAADLRHRRRRRRHARGPRKIFQVYGFLPSYRAMLDREGADGPGRRRDRRRRERPSSRRIQRLADAGATDFAAAEFGAGADERRGRGSCSSRCCERRRRRAARRRSSCSRRSRREEVEIAPDLRHLEIYTMRGSAHDPVARSGRRRARRGDGRRRDGRPARSGRRALPRPRRASSRPQGIGTMRVGYRKPNDLASLRARRRRRGRPRGRAPARAGIRDDRPLVRRRGRGAGRHRARRALRGRRHALDAVGRLRGRRRARRRLPCCSCTATATRSCRPTRSFMVRMLAGHGES